MDYLLQMAHDAEVAKIQFAISHKQLSRGVVFSYPTSETTFEVRVFVVPFKKESGPKLNWRFKQSGGKGWKFGM